MAIATALIGRTKNFLLREANRHNFSTVAGGYWRGELGRRLKDGNVKCESSCWIPHPRSGIYYPKGDEWVMNDVPEGAANFDRTFWLRNDDVVEKSVPEVSPNAK